MNSRKLRFMYTDIFNDSWASLGLTEKQRTDFELTITSYYENLPSNNHGKSFPGSIIQGTGGAYKYRYSDPNSNKGKSSSYRTIYFVAAQTQLLFFDIYSKHQKESLTAKEKAQLRKFAKNLHRKDSL